MYAAGCCFCQREDTAEVGPVVALRPSIKEKTRRPDRHICSYSGALQCRLARAEAALAIRHRREPVGMVPSWMRLGSVVRAEGLEPSRGLRPNGFSYQRRLSPPCRDRVLVTLRQVRGLDYTFTMAVRPAGAARLVSTPSPPEFSVGTWLGIAI